ncbi:MAG TPA: hypothetical protein VFJ02_09150 [Vicinamibacterales bacterium]|nr:hypothetical protein [Vicinamibacterales bacterium]
MIPIIEEAALRAAMTPRIAVDVIRAAFIADGQGRTHVPGVINLDLPQAHGEFHIKTAAIDGVPHIAVKIASGFYDNPSRGLPSGAGLMAVFDAATGMPGALLLDNGFLTDIRTAAAGAVAADLLARPDIDIVGVIGSGVQARMQVHCLATVRRVGAVVAWSPTPGHLVRYCDELNREGIAARPASSPEDVCRQADLIITATPSRAPIVRSQWLRPGTHITALGADAPGKQELDPECLARADLVVVDRLSQCAAFGELKHAIDRGCFSAAQVHAELGTIAAGRKAGRTTPEQLTIADLTGVGFQDTAIASAALATVNIND